LVLTLQAVLPEGREQFGDYLRFTNFGLLFSRSSGWSQSLRAAAVSRCQPSGNHRPQREAKVVEKKSIGFWSILGHPLFLLIVGSVIGSFLIPHISQETGKKRALQEARLRKAVEIVDNNTRTASQLNSIVTRLGSFHNDNVRLKPSPARLSLLQDKLSEDINSQYAEFQKTGWWWYRDLNEEAVILEIVPATGSDKLKADVNAYGENILQTVSAFNDFWHICLSSDYEFAKDGKVTQIENTMHKRFEELFNARVQLVNNLVQDFRSAE
jgi:hypothetical protein